MTDGEYNALMRRKLLESIYDKMDEEDKRVFVQMTMQDADYRDIMRALQSLSKQVEDGRQSWWADFGANIAGNTVTGGAAWLLSRILK